MPLGSGLGFVVGANIAGAMGAWQWGIRATPIAGIIILVLLTMLVAEPKRGAAEEVAGARLQYEGKSSHWEDVKELACTRTYVFCVSATTALTFVLTTLGWWEPTIIQHSVAWNLGLSDTRLLPKNRKGEIGLTFGAITAASGLVGTAMGTLLSGMIREGRGILRLVKTERAPPIVSGLGVLIATPLLLLGSIFGHESIIALWILLFLGLTSCFFNCALTMDILMSVIVPSKRSTAFSYYMLIAQFFGAISPYIVGAVSDAIREERRTPETQYISLVKASSASYIVLLISAALYMICATTILTDQSKLRKEMGMTNTSLRRRTSSTEKLNEAPEWKVDECLMHLDGIVDFVNRYGQDLYCLAKMSCTFGSALFVQHEAKVLKSRRSIVMVNERKDYISITILFVANLFNYIDRCTIAGVLTQIQSYYQINNSMAGLIQTVFLLFLMIASPLSGYLGDRLNRKVIVILSMIIWMTGVVCSTLVPAEHFWMFLLFRGVVGIGEASYTSACPSMISDMFHGKARTHMYMLFYFAIPVGSGIGFVVGANVASLMGSWQWGVRVSTIAGIIVLALLTIFVNEPKRGAAEESMGAQLSEGNSSHWEDIKAIASIPTYVSCTWAYTALIFVSGTLVWWQPTIIEHLMAWNLGLNSTELLPNDKKNEVGFTFGAIVALSGLIGMSVGTFLSGMLRQGRGIFRPFKTERAQPIVSGLGALIASPLLLLIIMFGHTSLTALWVLTFFGVTCLCFNWSLNIDMLTSVVIPRRRSTAFAYFVLNSHLFGDVAAPYIIGAISDAIRGETKTPKTQYLSLVESCSVTVVLLCISGVLYMICAKVLPEDQLKFKREMGMLPRPLWKLTSSDPPSEESDKISETQRFDTMEEKYCGSKKARR
ncbi:hypothetical protein KIN20_037057 [Parelaphostrongylus tenuis]|uniref:Major facilitator superfamily (MFS) profile domain-containing protein n=1 Tax=Parelaphostrongylus tenuis TaxID=148309 RepID=A0AAD5WL10_PARTN|nr:hypothetical protein KIN20_037057 [Parelaphostrongylus tenuis]